MSKKAILGLGSLFMVSCGPVYNGIDGLDGLNGKNGHNSIIEMAASGTPGCTTILSALDTNDNGIIEPGVDERLESATVCNGLNGRDGIDGTNGKDGSDGKNGVDGAAGRDGTNGRDGVDGQNGSNGKDGVDGTNGKDGSDAPPTAFTPVGIVDPCGATPGYYNEVFLRLQNGTLLASFSDNSNGKNTRWAILVPGTYITTDGTNCTFTVDAHGMLTNEHR